MSYILEIIHEKNMSIDDVAYKMNIEKTLLESWIKKDYIMTINQAVSLSKILKTSLTHLYLHPDIKTLDISHLDNHQIGILYDIFKPELRYDKKKYLSKSIDLINTEDLGERIKFIRTEILGWTQSRIAETFHVSRNTAKYWDYGLYFTSLDRARDFSILSNISLDFILLPKHPLELISYGIDNDLFKTFEQLVIYFNEENGYVR